MGETDYRRGFEEVLKLDPYDQVTRLVFADWLEDHGYDDEAVEQRRRATPAWIEADKWMQEFAVLATEFEPKVSVQDVIAATRRFLKTEEQSTLSGLGFNAVNAWYDDSNLAKTFWKQYQAWTGEVVAEEQQSEPFGCCL